MLPLVTYLCLLLLTPSKPLLDCYRMWNLWMLIWLVGLMLLRLRITIYYNASSFWMSKSVPIFHLHLDSFIEDIASFQHYLTFRSGWQHYHSHTIFIMVVFCSCYPSVVLVLKPFNFFALYWMVVGY